MVNCKIHKKTFISAGGRFFEIPASGGQKKFCRGMLSYIPVAIQEICTWMWKMWERLKLLKARKGT